MRVRQVERRLPLVALTNFTFLQTGQPGESPWLGGIDIDDFGGDPLKAIKSFGAGAFSPVHGFPENGEITDPDHRPYVTKAMVDQAHRMGLKVVPWTIDDQPTMEKLIDDGVDGIITDNPDRLRNVMQARGLRLPRAYTPRCRRARPPPTSWRGPCHSRSSRTSGGPEARARRPEGRGPSKIIRDRGQGAGPAFRRSGDSAANG